MAAKQTIQRIHNRPPERAMGIPRAIITSTNKGQTVTIEWRRGAENKG